MGIENFVKERRAGRFKVDQNLIEKDPEIALLIMPHMIVMRAESMHMYRVVEYMAYSALFDPLPFMSEVPQYNIIIKDNQVTAERI